MIICKIKDLKPGNRFTYEDTSYIMVDLNPSTCFVGSSKPEQTIFCALNMKTYKVNCFLSDTTVFY
jgi:hypothetical protein